MKKSNILFAAMTAAAMITAAVAEQEKVSVPINGIDDGGNTAGPWEQLGRFRLRGLE